MTRIKSYWDLEEDERFSLTAEEIKHYIDVELMKEGLVRPIKPDLPEVPPKPVTETTEFYRVKFGYDNAYLFATIEQAEAFIKLMPYKESYHNMPSKSYSGNNLEFASPYTEAKIEPIQISTEAQATAVRAEWTEWAKKKKEFDELNDAYNDMLSACQKIEEKIYEDQAENERSIEEGKDILRRYHQFMKLSDNIQRVAVRFLLQKFSSQDLYDKLRILDDEEAIKLAKFIDENAEELNAELQE